MTHPSHARVRSNARQRGMALLIAVAMLSLVGIVMGAAMSFAHSDVRRTSVMHEQAQARLLLVAAQHLGDAPLPTLPSPECRWRATQDAREQRAVTVACGRTQAWQRMARQGERWVIVAAGGEFSGDSLGIPGADAVPSTP
jgi:hypothetical protein